MKRVVSLTLVLVLILCMIPVISSADESNLGMRTLGSGETYQQMSVSDDMITMIMDVEGFYSTAYWDVSQWSIGYGSCLSTDKSYDAASVVWTVEQAKERLVSDVNSTYGAEVNNFCKKIGKQPSQQQFDALVSFTYNVGGGWMSGCRLSRWLENPTTLEEMINAMGVWCRVSGTVNYGICCRRVREIIVFLYGEYTLSNGTVPGAVTGVDTDLKVVDNGDLPYINFVVYQSNGGSFDSNVCKYTDYTHYYIKGTNGITAPNVTRDGYTLSGWTITRVNNKSTSSGDSFTSSHVMNGHLEVTAQWVKAEDSGNSSGGSSGSGNTGDSGSNNENTGDGNGSSSVALPFSDVPTTDWYYEYVQYVYENGLMLGTSDTTFTPGTNMTRGMLVTVLYRMAGEPEVTAAQMNQFTDVASSAYYAKAVAWAKANGIVNGISATQFAPDSNVTRQDAVVIFYRMLKNYYNRDVSSSVSLSGYADADKISDYAVDAIMWATDVGMLNGIPAGDALYVQPGGSLSRAQAAKLLTVFDVYLDN